MITHSELDFVVSSVCTSPRSLNHESWLTISASSCAFSLYVPSFFEPRVLAHDFGLFVCVQLVRALVLWTTSPVSRFRPLRVRSACTCPRSLNYESWLTISASSCAFSLYVPSFFELRVLAHDFGLFVCVQLVRARVLWTTSPGSRFRPLRVRSACTCPRSLNYESRLTNSASSCAFSVYVPSFFEIHESLASRFRPLRVCVQPVRCVLVLWTRSPGSRIRPLSCAFSVYVPSFFEPRVLAHDFGLFVCVQRVRALVLWTTSPGSRFRPLRVRSVCTCPRSLNHESWLTISPSLFVCVQIVRALVLWTTSPGSRFRPVRVRSACTCPRSLNYESRLTNSASSCAFSVYVPSFFEPRVLAHEFGLFVCVQPVRALVLWTTSPGSRFRPLRVRSACTCPRSLNYESRLTISAFSCAFSLYVPSFFEPRVLAHDFGLFVCVQYVRALVLWTTSPGSRFRPLRVRSGCTCPRSLNHESWLTISAFSCAFSMYVPSFFELRVPAHDFGLFVCVQYVRAPRSLNHESRLTNSASSCAFSVYVPSFFERRVLAHDFGLFMCVQPVRALVLWTTSPGSRFRPLRVRSVCTCPRSLNHESWLTISASSCAFRMYVPSFFEPRVLAHDFGLFVCVQAVRALVLWTTSPGSRFRPLRVRSVCRCPRSLNHESWLTISASSCVFEVCTCPRSLNHESWLTISASSCAFSLYVPSFFEPRVLAHDFGLFVCVQSVRALVLWTTSPGSRFRPLRVRSGCTCPRSLNHESWLTISAFSCAIRMYVPSFFAPRVLAHDFGLFVCVQGVRALVLWTVCPGSWFQP